MKQYLLNQIIEQMQMCEDLALLDLVHKLLLEGRNQ